MVTETTNLGSVVVTTKTTLSRVCPRLSQVGNRIQLCECPESVLSVLGWENPPRMRETVDLCIEIKIYKTQDTWDKPRTEVAKYANVQSCDFSAVLGLVPAGSLVVCRRNALTTAPQLHVKRQVSHAA